VVAAHSTLAVVHIAAKSIVTTRQLEHTVALVWQQKTAQAWPPYDSYSFRHLRWVAIASAAHCCTSCRALRRPSSLYPLRVVVAVVVAAAVVVDATTTCHPRSRTKPHYGTRAACRASLYNTSNPPCLCLKLCRTPHAMQQS
jgi:hypothetical protein